MANEHVWDETKRFFDVQRETAGRVSEKRDALEARLRMLRAERARCASEGQEGAHAVWLASLDSDIAAAERELNRTNAPLPTEFREKVALSDQDLRTLGVDPRYRLEVQAHLERLRYQFGLADADITALCEEAEETERTLSELRQELERLQANEPETVRAHAEKVALLEEGIEAWTSATNAVYQQLWHKINDLRAIAETRREQETKLREVSVQRTV